MTITSTSATSPAAASPPQPPAQPPAPGTYPGRPVSVAPMKSDLASSMRKTAARLEQTHPETVAGKHVRTAAGLVEKGQHDGAKRHLDAAMELMTPRNLMRHGVTDDEGHATAKAAMHQVNHHRLAVMDIQDAQARNTQAIQHKAATLQAQVQQRQAAAAAKAAARQAAVEQKTAAKPTGQGPGSQQQTGPTPDPILATTTATPTASGILLGWQDEARGPGGKWIHLGEGDRKAVRNILGHDAGIKPEFYDLGYDLDQADINGSVVRHDYGVTYKITKQGGMYGDSYKVEKSARPAAPAAMLAGLRAAVELSAQTARLASTPHPNGRPGGPGLYDKKGNQHSPYFQQIVHALMTKRGMSQADASRIAWGALRKWSRGGGGVHPEVRAAASGALVREQAAKLSGDPWEQAARLIELATVELGGTAWASQPRVPAGQAGGGQFGSNSGGTKQPAGGKGNRAQRRARLIKEAVALRGEIASLLSKIHAATHHKSKSSTPAKKGAAAISAKQAAASKSAASAAKHPAKAGTKAAAKSQTVAQMRAEVSALRAQLHTVMSQIHSLANEERAAIELSARTAYLHEPRGRGGQWVRGAAADHAAMRARQARQQKAAIDITSGGRLHPAVEARVQKIAGQMDTGVQASAAKDAAAKAQAAAAEARKALEDAQAASEKAETKAAREKAAVEGGIALAAVAAAWIETKLGVPDIIALLTPTATTLIQVLIEWAKKL